MRHTHTMKYHSSIKNNEIMSFAATWMDLDMIILHISEASQIKEKSYHMVSPICGL